MRRRQPIDLGTRYRVSTIERLVRRLPPMLIAIYIGLALWGVVLLMVFVALEVHKCR